MANPKVEVAEGFLRYDTDDGWILDGGGPRSGVRVRDLFQEFDGKRVKITIEILPNKLSEED
jgi:hypothetical protein